MRRPGYLGYSRKRWGLPQLSIRFCDSRLRTNGMSRVPVRLRLELGTLLPPSRHRRKLGQGPYIYRNPRVLVPPFLDLELWRRRLEGFGKGTRQAPLAPILTVARSRFFGISVWWISISVENAYIDAGFHVASSKIEHGLRTQSKLQS